MKTREVNLDLMPIPGSIEDMVEKCGCEGYNGSFPFVDHELSCSGTICSACKKVIDIIEDSHEYDEDQDSDHSDCTPEVSF